MASALVLLIVSYEPATHLKGFTCTIAPVLYSSSHPRASPPSSLLSPCSRSFINYKAEDSGERFLDDAFTQMKEVWRIPIHLKGNT